jgi:hypothetical protein
MASEEYASRIASPKPASSGRPASISDKTGPSVKSPLHQTNFPVDQLTRTTTHESEPEDVIHIDPPSHRASKIGGGGYDPPKEDLGPEGGNSEEKGGWVHEQGHGVPILASDEIGKHPGAEYRQPAISPELIRRGSGEYILNESDGTPNYLTKQRSHSRNSSRNKIQASQRFAPSPSQQDRSSTPLDSTKEYEPLFPEDDEKTNKPKTATDKHRRPDLARHHFPSQDVWEDTPSSLQLETTVDTPQSPEEEPETTVHAEEDATHVFESAQAEQARKDNITEEDQKSFLPEHTKRFANKHLNKDHLDIPQRPGMQQRFPSQDIWEDAPDHGQLETTVSGPQTPDTNEYADESPVEKPQIPARPSIPARPQKPKEFSPVDKKAPLLPEKPKPQIPVRPSKPSTISSEKVPTTDAQGTGGEGAPQPKAKPPVPARPAGGKIAALQAGFLKDLNSKLGLGPQAPKIKEPEPEEEAEPAKPLTDARKGRAKGPQRRKPAASTSPAPAATVTSEVAVPRAKMEFASVTTIWSIGDDGDVDVPAAKMASKLSAAFKSPAKAEDTVDEKLQASEKEPEDTPAEAEAKEPEVDLARETSQDSADAEPAEEEIEKTVSKESEPAKPVEKELENPVEEAESKPEEAKSSDSDADAEAEDEPQGGIQLEKSDTMPGEFPEPTPVEEQIQSVVESNEAEGKVKIHDV